MVLNLKIREIHHQRQTQSTAMAAVYFFSFPCFSSLFHFLEMREAGRDREREREGERERERERESERERARERTQFVHGMALEPSTLRESLHRVSGGKCQVCNERACRYTCPKCGIQYCNLECYRKHSSGCVDAFYR